jgi:hypothetical protein
VSYKDRVHELASVIELLPSAGVVYSSSRYAAELGKFIQLFKDGDGRINGWEVSRRAGTWVDGLWVETYVLRHYLAVRDADVDDQSSDMIFQNALDDVARAFIAADPSFGEITTGVVIGEIDERMFGNFLCHFVECLLDVTMSASAI